jgi:hypothetical protein
MLCEGMSVRLRTSNACLIDLCVSSSLVQRHTSGGGRMILD